MIENYSSDDNITIDYITEYDDWDSRSIEYIQFLLPEAHINYYDIRNGEDPELTSPWRIYNVEDIFYVMEDSDLLVNWQNLRLAVDGQSPEGKNIMEKDFPILSVEDKYYLLHDQNMASQTAADSGEWSNNGLEGFLVYGPYMSLDQGEYELKIQMEISASVDALEKTSIGYIDICSCGREIARTDIWTGDNEITLPFVLNEDMEQMEFRVFVSEDNHLQIRQMVLEKTDRQ